MDASVCCRYRGPFEAFDAVDEDHSSASGSSVGDGEDSCRSMTSLFFLRGTENECRRPPLCSSEWAPAASDTSSETMAFASEDPKPVVDVSFTSRRDLKESPRITAEVPPVTRSIQPLPYKPQTKGQFSVDVSQEARAAVHERTACIWLYE